MIRVPLHTRLRLWKLFLCLVVRARRQQPLEVRNAERKTRTRALPQPSPSTETTRHALISPAQPCILSPIAPEVPSPHGSLHTRRRSSPPCHALTRHSEQASAKEAERHPQTQAQGLHSSRDNAEAPESWSGHVRMAQAALLHLT